MTIDINDPRLTAYALGELDESEHAEVEAAVNASDDLQRIVNEIRETAELVTAELKGESFGVLTDDQRSTIEAEATQLNGQVSTKNIKTPWFIRRWWIPTSLAASVLLTATLWQVYMPHLSRAREHSSTLLAYNVSTHQGIPTPESETSYGYQVPSQGKTQAQTRKRTGIPVGGNKIDTPSRRKKLATKPQARPSESKTQMQQQARRSQLRGKRLRSIRLAGATWRRRYADGAATMDAAGYSLTTNARALRVVALESVPSDEILRLVQRLKEESDQTNGVGPREPFHTESYDHTTQNPFRLVMQEPLSTFSIDVDAASYANVRRFLTQGRMPPAGAVRIEEMINYFNYDYPPPTGDDPFSVNVEVATCPWNSEHRLVRIGIQGFEYEPEERPSANLVFLLDVSGSMRSANKLPLLKQAMEMLVGQLRDDDQVAIVVYAGSSGLVLDSTACSNRNAILDALERLQSGGSTNGGAGIRLAYDIAAENFIDGGANRVILATDGDFNVGTTSQGELIDLIEQKARSGVFLTVLGFGMGNYNDSTLEKLADKGNGNYAYIDTELEARKVLVEQVGGTLVTIAKDVKIQVEFNPVEVSAYRLIGYENRMLAARDFNDDTKDAGEIGSGHSVTAFYEIIPAGVDVDLPRIDALKYQVSARDRSDDGEAETDRDEGLDDGESELESSEPDDQPRGLKPAARSGELMTVKFRYKEPDGDTSKLIEVAVVDQMFSLAEASDDFAFAASVASFGMLLRGHPETTLAGDAFAEGAFSYEAVLELAKTATGPDPFGYRYEFLTLVDRARELRE